MRATYFGHAAFRFDAGNSVVLVDPFLTGNPHFKGDVEQATAGTTHILLTHGHNDHVGDTLAIAKRTGAKVVGMVELCASLARRGVDGGSLARANTGGTVHFDDFSVTLTQAFHSSSFADENGNTVYLGPPNGLVIRFKGGPTVYHMGDTDIFGDMELIQTLHQPDIGLVPIGDTFTMGAHAAALACRRYFSFRTIIPTHWGTFPVLDASPDAFVAAMGDRGASVSQPAIGEAFEL